MTILEKMFIIYAIMISLLVLIVCLEKKIPNKIKQMPNFFKDMPPMKEWFRFKTWSLDVYETNRFYQQNVISRLYKGIQIVAYIKTRLLALEYEETRENGRGIIWSYKIEKSN